MLPACDTFSDGRCSVGLVTFAELLCMDDSVILAGFREGVAIAVGCLGVPVLPADGAVCPHRLPFFAMPAVRVAALAQDAFA